MLCGVVADSKNQRRAVIPPLSKIQNRLGEEFKAESYGVLCFDGCFVCNNCKSVVGDKYLSYGGG
jgi:hypothetical protein